MRAWHCEHEHHDVMILGCVPPHFWCCRNFLVPTCRNSAPARIALASCKPAISFFLFSRLDSKCFSTHAQLGLSVSRASNVLPFISSWFSISVGLLQTRDLLL